MEHIKTCDCEYCSLFTPGPLYAAPIRGVVLGFPETLKFLVTGRGNRWAGATLTIEDATLYAAAPDLLAALEMAGEFVKIARLWFPKSMRNSDKFMLERTCASIGATIAKAKGKG